MSRAVKGEPEPPHCVQYHEYIDALAKMKNDSTLKKRQKLVAEILWESVSYHHMKLCVPESWARGTRLNDLRK